MFEILEWFGDLAEGIGLFFSTIFTGLSSFIQGIAAVAAGGLQTATMALVYFAPVSNTIFGLFPLIIGIGFAYIVARMIFALL